MSERKNSLNRRQNNAAQPHARPRLDRGPRNTLVLGLDQVSIVVKDEQNTPYLDEIVFGYLSGDYQNKTEIRRIDTDWGSGTNGITTFDMLISDHTVIDGASYYICVNPKSMSNNTDFNYRKITIKYHLE